MQRVSEGLRPTLPSTIPPARRRLIYECLSDTPASRPSFCDVVARLKGPIRQELLFEREDPLSPHHYSGGVMRVGVMSQVESSHTAVIRGDKVDLKSRLLRVSSKF